jgi:glutamate 5-kinase
VVGGGASLLAVGVTGWDAEFRAGDGVELVGPDGDAFARGIASVDSGDLAARPTNVEAIHRDRLVLL